MLKLSVATCVAAVLTIASASAETTGGATLAGGDNGHAAKVDQSMRTSGYVGSDTKSGAPSARLGPGQSTEHTDSKMRGY